MQFDCVIGPSGLPSTPPYLREKKEKKKKKKTNTHTPLEQPAAKWKSKFPCSIENVQTNGISRSIIIRRCNRKPVTAFEISIIKLILIAIFAEGNLLFMCKCFYHLPGGIKGPNKKGNKYQCRLSFSPLFFLVYIA